jgi:hypothetical protein
MLKNLFFAAIAAGLVAAVALPVHVTPAEAAMTCKEAAKAKFSGGLKDRHAYRKACKKAWKAAHKS